MARGGFVLVAKRLTDSELWFKPDKYLKVWLYILLHVDSTTGEWFFPSGEIEKANSATADQVKKIVAFLEARHSISSRRGTRGRHIKVLRFSKYQTISEYTAPATARNRHYDKKLNNEINTIKSDSVKGEVTEIYEAYIVAFGSDPNRYKLTPRRKAKIALRLEDAGKLLLLEAIKKTADSPFHRGDNDRGWKADLDFITRSYEQTESLANMEGKKKEVPLQDKLKRIQEEARREKKF